MVPQLVVLTMYKFSFKFTATAVFFLPPPQVQISMTFPKSHAYIKQPCVFFLPLFFFFVLTDGHADRCQGQFL